MAKAEEQLNPSLEQGRRPAIFMFQPHTFKPVTPERLAEWEYSIANYFGLPSPRFDKDDVLRSATWSDSGGGGLICPDDSDYYASSADGAIAPDATAAESIASGRRPSIFMWQISRFRVIPPDKLAEWENSIREQVGLPVSTVDKLERSATGSSTLPHDCFDDSDYAEA